MDSLMHIEIKEILESETKITSEIMNTDRPLTLSEVVKLIKKNTIPRLQEYFLNVDVRIFSTCGRYCCSKIISDSLSNLGDFVPKVTIEIRHKSNGRKPQPL